MKRSEKRTAHLAVNSILQISFIVILGFFMFSDPGYGSSDFPVNVNSTPVATGTAAMFTGSGIGSVLANLGNITGVNGNIDISAASTFVTESDDNKETLHDIETVDGTVHTAHPQCQDSCSL